MKMELTECSETPANKIQTLRSHPKERILRYKDGFTGPKYSETCQHQMTLKYLVKFLIQVPLRGIRLLHLISERVICWNL